VWVFWEWGSCLIFLGLFIRPERRGEIRISRTSPHKFQAIILSAPVRSVTTGGCAMDTIWSSGTRTRVDSGIWQCFRLENGSLMWSMWTECAQRLQVRSKYYVRHPTICDRLCSPWRMEPPLLKHPIISIIAYPQLHPHCTALPNSWIFSSMRFKGI